MQRTRRPENDADRDGQARRGAEPRQTAREGDGDWPDASADPHPPGSAWKLLPAPCWWCRVGSRRGLGALRDLSGRGVVQGCGLGRRADDGGNEDVELLRPRG